MANHKSALKRARQDEVRRLRNKSTKTRVKNIIKDIRETASNNESKESFSKGLNTAKSIIDKAAKKGVI
ncbi:MAG: 30S ribosomal protein S20, partial [Desulfobacterium sp.]|nr:30S ribosomal protein S20 [Desulfobacterium sp.]MBU4035688.1 30S ribosomal protein S20 [Pseudomonadota bacterium]